MFVFDTRTLALLHTWTLGVDQPLNLAFDAKGQRLFVTDQGLKQIDGMRAKRVPDFKSAGPGNRVAIIDAASGKLAESFPTGDGPTAPLLDPERNRLFVTNRRAGSVTVFDATDHRLLHTVPLADHPSSLAIDPKTGAVFVTIKSKQGTPPGTNEGAARIEFR
jgi:YVTN family beta-propeller protein